MNQGIATPSARISPARLAREASMPPVGVAPCRMLSGDRYPSRLLLQDHPSRWLGGDAAISRVTMPWWGATESCKTAFFPAVCITRRSATES